MARARKVHVRCMRARLEKISRFVFSTNIVCPYMEYMRLVGIIESNVRGLCNGPCTQGARVRARTKGA